MKIAFLGTGLMGSGFVRRMRSQGHEVRVWNRSAAKAQALQDCGAIACADAAAAIAGAERVHLSLSDDAAVDAVLEPLAAQVPAGCWVIDHTTTSVHGTLERASRWQARPGQFLHAPVFMGPANALEGTGLMLLSASAQQHEALAPALQAMTGKLVYMGTEPQRAAAFKLFGNLTILGLMGVLGDVNRLAHALGMNAQEAFSLFEHFNPGQTLPARAARIATGDFSKPSFELAMARKDVRLMEEEAQRAGVKLFMMSALAAEFDAALARGEGALDATAVARAPI